jgi:small subunit ribosomal protein S2
MPVATRRELLEAGVHFGHQTKRWNPKMRRFLYGQRSGIYIIDLEQTLSGLERAHDFLADIGARNGVVLFVGTKKQAQEVVAEQATRVNMPFVNTRWLGGMLTNFQTIYGRLKRLKELRDMERSGAFEFLPKKEVLKLRHEKEKLERNLAGIQDMERLPDAIFVIDTKKEHIAVTEARKLGVPVVAIVDSNCDPDEVDYVIPGNDDAIRACTVITRVVADAVQEGQYLAYQRMQRTTVEPEFEREPAAEVPEVLPEVESPRVTLSAEEAAWMGIGVEAGDVPASAEPAAASSAEGTGAETPADVSAGWAAPRDTPVEESRTVPDVSGPAQPPENVEDQVDFAPEPEGEGTTPDNVTREGLTDNAAGQVRAPAGESVDKDAPDARDAEALRPEEAARSE